MSSSGCLVLAACFSVLSSACFVFLQKTSLFFPVCFFFSWPSPFVWAFCLWLPFVLPTRNVKSISSQRPPRPSGQIALSCRLFRTLFPRSSTLSVVFQVNGINVEPCTHKEVVSPAIIHDFPPFIPGLALRLSCSAVVPTVGVAFIRVYLGGTFPSSLSPPPCFHLLLLSKPPPPLSTQTPSVRGRFSAAEM